MAAIRDLLNNNLDDAVEVHAFTNAYNVHSLPEDFFPAGAWEDSAWSNDLTLEPQSWDNLYDGLFISDSQLGDDFPLDHFAESNIEGWAAKNLAAGQDELTPPLTQTEESFSEVDSQTSRPAVCYGMLYRTAARLSGEMSHLDTKLRSPHVARRATNYVFSMRRSATHITLFFADGGEFAILNAQISKALVDLLELPSVEFEVLADGVSVREIVRTAKKANDATVRVNINIYGSADIRNELADLFSKHKIWLQHPEHQRPESIYDNPHYLWFPDIALEDSSRPEMAATVDDSNEDKQEEFQQAISEVYASLKRDSRLKTIEGDSRVTPLLPHQKTALDFMLQREVGPIESEFSLWEPDNSVADNANGEHGFSHVITKTKCRVKPPEVGGGILADEMGMGKSLSILALIIQTLDGANAWRLGDDASFNDLSVEEGQALKPSRATLVLVPSALLLHEWQAEIKKHIRESLKVTVYHGRGRDRQIVHMVDSDVVLTTYQTIAIESSAKSGERSPLLDFAWFRIVLDEAHVIRRRTTTFYETVSKLQGKSRWCLSGTPIQNKLEDIGNLFAFIRAYPFDKIGMFRKCIIHPFEQGRTRDGASKHLGQLIDSVCLRRSRGLLDLPSQKERLRELKLSPAERAQYEKTKRQMSRRLQRGTIVAGKDNTFGQFHVQLQLRIICNHGTYQNPLSWMHRDLQNEREALYQLSSGQNKEVKCSLCGQSVPSLSTNQVYRTLTKDCAHVLCDGCLEVQLEEGRETERRGPTQCPICRPVWESMPSPERLTPPSSQEAQDEYFAPIGKAAKMDALVEDLVDGLLETKSIVFSCWTKTLDLIARHLKNNYIVFGRIDGGSAVADRQSTLENFETSKQMRVLIMTTGTGAFGLNLAAANRIFIVEPQWNPSIENQAIARALRLGQEQHVQVIRYVVKDTVETEMRNQQKRKIKMASLADMATTS